MPLSEQVFLIDDDRSLLRVLTHHLESEGMTVVAFQDPFEAKAKMEKQMPEVVVCDIRMPGMDGFELLNWIKKNSSDTQVVMITGHASVESAVTSMKKGAFDFLQKPVDRNHLSSMVQNALKHGNLLRENRDLKNRIHKTENEALFQSRVMNELFTQADQIAPSEISVLILGETGTGKEVLARRLHNKSSRSDKPFIAVNCSAIPPNIIESELFGHRKGAFTHATSDRTGWVQAADGGTLFLDEIGDLPLDLQPKLLRTLQEKELFPVGADKPVSVDIRVISATNRNLEKMVKEGKFRQDLLYRIKVIQLSISPLRDRREDILLLFRHFFNKQRKHDTKPPLPFHSETIQKLESYSWPGNVREVQNAAIRAAVLASGKTLMPNHLPSEISSVSETGSGAPSLPQSGLDLEKWIDHIVIEALKRNEWNQTKAAKFLNISRNTLTYRLDKRNLPREDEKE